MPQHDPTFKLLRYNPRRVVRGAAEVEVRWPDGDVVSLWMTRDDVEKNIQEFGRVPGLVDALDAYHLNVAIGL